MDLRGLFKFSDKKNELEGSVANTVQVSDAQNGVKCPKCSAMLKRDELEAALNVCSACGAYLSVSARDRIKMLADRDSFEEHDTDITSPNPLDFPGYKEKLELARRKSSESDAVVCGTMRVGKRKCAVFSMDAAFMMGSMGTVVGDKITRIFEYAEEQRLPVIGITVSGGARMQEGMLSLMQMAKVSGAVKRHSDAGLLYAVLLTNPTTGGVTASFAMLGDIIAAEPGALVGFAGPRVIEQTIRKKLPDGFQSAESLLKCGFVDIIVPRAEQRFFFAKLLKLHNCPKEDV